MSQSHLAAIAIMTLGHWEQVKVESSLRQETLFPPLQSSSFNAQRKFSVITCFCFILRILKDWHVSRLSQEKTVAGSTPVTEEIATVTTGKESVHFPFSHMSCTCVIEKCTVLPTAHTGVT